MSKLNLTFIILAVTMIAIGQLGMKYAATHMKTSGNMSILDFITVNYKYILVIFVVLFGYLISTGLWIAALRGTPLALAYMFNAAAFIIIPIASSHLFSEKLSPTFWLGAGFIVIGIILALKGVAIAER